MKKCILLIIASLFLWGCSNSAPSTPTVSETVSKTTETDSPPEVMEDDIETNEAYTNEEQNEKMNSVESMNIMTANVDAGFLEAVFQNEPEAHLTNLIGTDGRLSEMYAALYPYYADYDEGTELFGFEGAFIQYIIDGKNEDGTYKIRELQILPLLMSGEIAGYFSYCPEYGDYSQYHWNSIVEGTKENAVETGIPIGFFHQMKYIFHAINGNDSNMFVKGYKSYFIVNKNGWYPLEWNAVPDYPENVGWEEAQRLSYELTDNTRDLLEIPYKDLITIVQQGTGKELEEKKVHDLFNKGIEEGDMYYDATLEFQKKLRQIN